MKPDSFSIEILEARIAPANITAAVMGHTLKITGNDTANDITIRGAAGDAFDVICSTDTINNGGSGFATMTGITDISIKLLGGDDSVTFDNSPVAIHLKGGLKIDGGDGANTVTSTDLTVDKNLSITNGDAGMGTHKNFLTNLTVKGSVMINNGNGNTQTAFGINSPRSFSIYKNLSITNGTGQDGNSVSDENIGGNVTIKNGHGSSGGSAGQTSISRSNGTFQPVIKGNVSVSYIDGDSIADYLSDVDVFGNFTVNHGPGTFDIAIDGNSMPAAVHGNFTVSGAAFDEVHIGANFGSAGMIVGKNFSVTGSDSLSTFNKLQVGGNTKLTVSNTDTFTISNSIFTGTFTHTSGGGANSITIDDTKFEKAYTSMLGGGAVTFKLDTNTGTTLPTTFEGPVSIKSAGGGGSITFAGTSDNNQEVIVESTFIIHTGGASITLTQNLSHELFPFGTFI